MAEIETTNDHLVGRRGDHTIVTFPPHAPMGRDEALRLAAWLVAVTDESADYSDFHAVLEAVSQT